MIIRYNGQIQDLFFNSNSSIIKLKKIYLSQGRSRYIQPKIGFGFIGQMEVITCGKSQKSEFGIAGSVILKVTMKGREKMVETILKIEGMACAMCESHINDCIRNHFTVKKVKSSHSQGETRIISEQSLDKAKLQQVIAETGYVVQKIKENPYQKKGLFG